MHNPYNYHLPVKSNEMFFGREDLLGDLSKGLSEALPVSSAIIGGRRIGKTSLLEKLARYMSGNVHTKNGRRLIPCSYDPQAGRPLRSSDDFFRWVLEVLGEALPERNHPVSTRWLEHYETDCVRKGPVIAFQSAFIRQLKELDGEHIRLVLLLDEADSLFSFPWHDDLRPNLRYLLSRSDVREAIAIVTIGSTEFHAQITERDSPLENVLNRYWLGNLSHNDSLALIQKPSGEVVTPEVANEVWRQTGGHPCLIQFIMHELWEGLDAVTVQDVQEVATKFSDRVKHFVGWRRSIGKLGDIVYQWLAEQNGPVTFTDIKNAHPDIGGVQLSATVDVLYYHGLVNVEGRGHERYYSVAGKMYCGWLSGILQTPSDAALPAVERLHRIRPGIKDAKTYEQHIYELLCRFFAGQLSHPERESKTVGGTERRDIIFYNDSSHKFWQMIGQAYTATNIVFECKNTKRLKLDHVNQLVEYLGQPLGNFGVIVSRLSPMESLQRKAVAAFNRNGKVVLFLSDQDVGEMAQLDAQGMDPTQVIERKYVEFIRAVQ